MQLPLALRAPLRRLRLWGNDDSGENDDDDDGDDDSALRGVFAN